MPVTYALRPLLFSLAFIRNMRSGGMCVPGSRDDGLQLGHQRGMRFVERFELVEDGIEQRSRKDGDHDQRQRDQPGPQPVAARRDADDPVEEQQNRRAQKQRESQRLRQIAEPARPALHADAVVAADQCGRSDPDGRPASVTASRKTAKKSRPCIQRRRSRRSVHAARRQAQREAKHQPENGQSPERADDVEHGLDAAEGNGFGQLVRRQRVGLLVRAAKRAGCGEDLCEANTGWMCRAEP